MNWWMMSERNPGLSSVRERSSAIGASSINDLVIGPHHSTRAAIIPAEVIKMKLVTEFKEFALKGNVIDLAVGVIIGAAFNSVVRSLVDDVVMPPLGRIIGGVDFANLYVNLSDQEYESLAAAQEAGAATINYGLFINSVISFLIVAFCVFVIIRQVNRMKRAPEKATPTVWNCPFCDSQISNKAQRCPHCTSEVRFGG